MKRWRHTSDRRVYEISGHGDKKTDRFLFTASSYPDANKVVEEHNKAVDEWEQKTDNQ